MPNRGFTVLTRGADTISAPNAGVIMSDDDAAKRERARQNAERRLAAGEWLRMGALGALLGGDRFSADYWLQTGVTFGGERFSIRYRRSPGGYREANPDDVRRALEAYLRQYQAGDADSPAAE